MQDPVGRGSLGEGPVRVHMSHPHWTLTTTNVDDRLALCREHASLQCRKSSKHSNPFTDRIKAYFQLLLVITMVQFKIKK
jgi:hypothetical protein